jgi:hypothetical protein
MVEVSVPGSPRGGHELGGNGAKRDDDTCLPGCLDDYAEVFVMQVNAESGSETPVQHVRPFLLKDT